MTETLRWAFYPQTQLQRFSDIWQSINAASSNSPVLDPGYVFALVHHLGSGQELLAIGSRGGHPCAAAIVVRGKPGSWRTFEAGGCPFGAWVCEPGVCVSAALRALLLALPGFGFVIGLTRQDPAMLERPADSGAVHTLDYIETPSISVDCPFDVYWGKRSRSFRQNVRTAINRQRKQGPERPSFAVLTDPADVARAVDEHGMLESGSWKAQTGNALHFGNAQGAFFRDAMGALASGGNACAFQFRYDGRLVGSALCVNSADTIIVLRTSFDQRERFTSPGQVMHFHMLKSIFDRQQFRRIEFYGAIMDWERQWTDESRIMYHINVYRTPVLATVQRFRERYG